MLVTDGVLEARDQSGMMLADDEFDEMLGQIADRDGRDGTADRMVGADREGGEPYDDLTVVVMSRGDDGSRD